MQRDARPRETIASEMLPLHSCFEDAGVLGALWRLYRRLRIDYAYTVDTTICTLPAWVQSPQFEDAVSNCDPARGDTAVSRAMALVRAQRRMRQLIDAESENYDTDRLCDTDLCPEPMQPLSEPFMDPHRVAAVVRLCHGELLEAYARQLALKLCPVDEVVLAPKQQAEFAQLCSDAGLVASWTSAHAEYLATIDDLLVGHPGRDPPTVVDLLVPPPELYTVPSAANNIDLIALYERTASPKACPKGSHCLLSLLSRVTNAGSRGWETTLDAVVKDSDGAVRVCMHAIGVALSGMHVCLHPAARRPWHVRLAVMRRWRGCNPSTDFRELVHECPVAIKEVVRLYLATLLAEDSATLDALSNTNLPAGQLSLPPRTVAPTCLQAAMHAFAAAGEQLALSPTTVTPSEAINGNLKSEPRSRKKSMARPSVQFLMTINARATVPLSYCCSWLGGRCGNSAAALCSTSTVVSSILGASFRADYVPFWLHSNHHGMRASRLDEAQYKALHTESAAHRMCTLLDKKTALWIQRLALTVNDASLLTVTETMALLKIASPHNDVADYDEEKTPSRDSDYVATSSASSRVVQDAEQIVLALDARSAAMIMLFARCCALRSQILAYDLGPSTREAQARAVCRRLLVEPENGETHEEAAMRRLPTHCTHVFACSECRRIVNARQDGSGKDVPFNEIGLSASMLRIDGAVCDGEMRCAKRSSAALRTALAMESAASKAEVETHAVCEDAHLPVDLLPGSVMAAVQMRGAQSIDGREGASDMAKLRRDIKSCFEQHPNAIACGGVPLVCVSVLGRVVRIFGEWHALCAFCGGLTRVHPSSRFRSDICCMRCDFTMLHGKEAAKAMQALLPKPPAPRCRYCGRHQPEGSSSRWKTIPAPADTGGQNAVVPPPLRIVHYCPTHWRSWLTNAHKELPTNIIFAHILQRARPMFGADHRSASIGNGRGRLSVISGAEVTEGDSLSVPNATLGDPQRRPRRKRISKNKTAIARRISQHTTAKRQRKQSGYVAGGSDNYNK